MSRRAMLFALDTSGVSGVSGVSRYSFDEDPGLETEAEKVLSYTLDLLTQARYGEVPLEVLPQTKVSRYATHTTSYAEHSREWAGAFPHLRVCGFAEDKSSSEESVSRSSVKKALEFERKMNSSRSVGELSDASSWSQGRNPTPSPSVASYGDRGDAKPVQTARRESELTKIPFVCSSVAGLLVAGRQCLRVAEDENEGDRNNPVEEEVFAQDGEYEEVFAIDTTEAVSADRVAVDTLRGECEIMLFDRIWQGVVKHLLANLDGIIASTACVGGSIPNSSARSSRASSCNSSRVIWKASDDAASDSSEFSRSSSRASAMSGSFYSDGDSGGDRRQPEQNTRRADEFHLRLPKNSFRALHGNGDSNRHSGRVRESPSSVSRSIPSSYRAPRSSRNSEEGPASFRATNLHIALNDSLGSTTALTPSSPSYVSSPGPIPSPRALSPRFMHRQAPLSSYSASSSPRVDPSSLRRSVSDSLGDDTSGARRDGMRENGAAMRMKGRGNVSQRPSTVHTNDSVYARGRRSLRRSEQYLRSPSKLKLTNGSFLDSVLLPRVQNRGLSVSYSLNNKRKTPAVGGRRRRMPGGKMQQPGIAHVPLRPFGVHESVLRKRKQHGLRREPSFAMPAMNYRGDALQPSPARRQISAQAAVARSVAITAPRRHQQASQQPPGQPGLFLQRTPRPKTSHVNMYNGRYKGGNRALGRNARASRQQGGKAADSPMSLPSISVQSYGGKDAGYAPAIAPSHARSGMVMENILSTIAAQPLSKAPVYYNPSYQSADHRASITAQLGGNSNVPRRQPRRNSFVL